MSVAKNSVMPSMREEIADDHALLALGRIDGGDEAEAKLLGDHRARDRERRDRQPRGDAEHRADEHLLDQQHQNGAERGGIDVVGVAMQRQQHGRQHQRERQPHARRDILLAKPRQQHQHRAGAREHQEKRGRERRQEREIDAHGYALLRFVIARSEATKRSRVFGETWIASLRSQ